MNRPAHLLAFLLTLLAIGCNRPEQSEEGTTKESAAQIPADSTYLKLGDALTQQAQNALMAQVMKQLQTGGTKAAMPYCHARAQQLTDSLRTVGEQPPVLFRRTSLQYRNPGNAPDALETAHLQQFAQETASGTKPVAFISRDGNRVHYFRPILIAMEGCLQCHGTSISAETQTLLQQHYPADKAIGYKLGDLRGAWHLMWEE